MINSMVWETEVEISGLFVNNVNPMIRPRLKKTDLICEKEMLKIIAKKKKKKESP